MVTFSFNASAPNASFTISIEQSYIFAKDAGTGKLTFWDKSWGNPGGEGRDFFSGEAIWLEAYRANGMTNPGEHIPFDSSRHPWKGESRVEDGFNGQSVFFDSAFEGAQIDTLLLTSGIGLPLIKNLPRRIGFPLAVLAAGLTVRSQTLDRNIPFVHNMSSSEVIRYKTAGRTR